MLEFRPLGIMPKALIRPCNVYNGQFQAIILARAVAVAVGRRSGGQLATTLVATKNVFIFFFLFFSFFSPSSPFLIEGVLGSKNLFSESGSKWPIT